jgi:GntR family transcriptional regulator/MocR family aminotransferase
MEDEGRVIYVGTFSKVLFPALRVGYVVVPRALWHRFLAAREALDLFPSTLYQLALADFLTEGHFARHLRRMRGVYLRRRDALLEGLDRHCAGILTVQNADAGLHVATTLPPDLEDVAVVQRVAARGLSPTALSSCYLGAERQSGLLLGFGGSTESRLRRAARLLGDALHEMR